MTTYQLWENVPGLCEEVPVLDYYPAENRLSDAAVVLFPGGGYRYRAEHEGKGYAGFLNSIGLDAFVCQYRCLPHRFPLELLDARRAIRFIRAHAADFAVDPEKIAAMGSSAGGHLAGLVSNYTDPIDFEGIDEIDKQPYRPNATILCYAVGHKPDETNVAHTGSFERLLGEGRTDYEHFSTDDLVSDDTPPAFLWHTSDDTCVNVTNSYLYAAALRRHNIPHELHVFPHGRHGLGLSLENPHVAQWKPLLRNWFGEIGWLPKSE